MFGFLKSKKNESVLDLMDGREVKYVTKRISEENGNIKETIMGKAGRITAINGEIRVICGETDVFCCAVKNAQYYVLLSGNGMTVSGVNSVTGLKEDIVVYFTYYRK